MLLVNFNVSGQFQRIHNNTDALRISQLCITLNADRRLSNFIGKAHIIIRYL